MIIKELTLDLNAIPRAARIVAEEVRRVFRHKRKPGPVSWDDLDDLRPDQRPPGRLSPDSPYYTDGGTIHSPPYDMNAGEAVIPRPPEGDHVDARGNQWINRPGEKPKAPPNNRGTR